MAAVSTQARRYRVEDLALFPDDGRLRELVDGEVVEWDVTTLFHGFFVLALSRLLGNFVFDHQFGMVVSSDPLVRIQGSEHDARGPDVAFYGRARIPRDLRAAAADAAPDVVIEVLSPSDRAGDVERKIGDWLRAGVRLLWYVNPETGTTMVYHGSGVARVGPDATLDGADVVPGFSMRLRDVLDQAAALTGAD